MIGLLLAAYAIARVLAGECGPIGQPCELLVATTMAARQQASADGDLLSVVEAGYYADAPATAESVAIAWMLVRGQVRAGPWLYVYSQQDMVDQGWRRGAIELEENGLRLHFSRREPWRTS